MDRKTSNIKLQYALRNNKIIYISDVPQEERGLKCNCVCPCCNTPLQARLGNIRQPHFAHNNSNCNPAIAQQTILHLLAKEIIEKEKTIMFPPYYISGGDVGLENKSYLTPYCCSKETTVSFDSVALEKRISDIIPDIIVKKDNRECLIEIAVTHFVDEEKQKKIAKLELPMIEIDLSNYSDSLDRQTLTDILKNNIDNKKWISNPRVFEKQKEEATRHFQEQIDAHQKKQEQIAREIEEREARSMAFSKYAPYKNPNAKKKIQYAFQPANHKNIIQALRDDKKAFLEYQKTKMYRKKKEIPFYCDIPIKGEFIFNCDRRIWQMKLFEKFIHNRSNKGVIIVNKSIKNYFVKYCKDERENKLINWNYYSVDINDGDNLLWIAIDEYLMKLHNLGFVRYDAVYHMSILEQAHSIIPPDNYYADLLIQAVSKVDCFSVDASKKIDEYIDKKSNS